MTKLKKRILTGTVVMLVVVAVIAMSRSKAVNADVVTVKSGSVISTVTEKGKIISLGTGDIFSEVQGKVKKVYVDDGDRVEKGALLAEIDVEDLEAQIARLEGELKAIGGLSSQAGSGSVEQLQSALEQAEVAYDLAKSAYRRADDLYSEGAITKAELEQAKAELDTSKKALDQASASLAAAKAQYQGQKESLTAQLDNLRSQRDKARITAGEAETVLIKKVKEGDFVTPGTLLFTLGSIGRTEVETYINSKDRANMRVGEEAAVFLEMPGKDVEVTAKILKISPAAEERVSSLGISEAKIKVTLEITEHPSGVAITPGVLVDVVMVTQEARNVLGLQKEAVFSDKGEDFVWVVKDGKALLTKVETGIEGDDLVEVTKGLAEGAVVIKNPFQQELREGVKVK